MNELSTWMQGSVLAMKWDQQMSCSFWHDELEEAQQHHLQSSASVSGSQSFGFDEPCLHLKNKKAFV
jgi:hypothetical protein